MPVLARRRAIRLSIVCLVSMLLAPSLAAALPAFPGAEGFGAIATGGRGGRVIKVTNLEATGPGSLQAALSATGPRVVVFTVSGVIPGDVTIANGDVTIAGQTAPGGGITIAGRLVARYSTDVGNIIIRHLRVRPPARPSSVPGNQYDAIQLSRQSRVILDHVSVAWGLDENIDLYEARDATVQWSTIEEAEMGGHPDGAQHNYGLINGPAGRRVTLHHNLFAHNKNRNPALANGPAEVRNNVIYDVQIGFVHHNEATGTLSITGNYYRRGPASRLMPFFFDDAAGAGLSYYLADNYLDDPGVAVGTCDNPWQTPLMHESFANIGRPASYRATAAPSFADGTPGYVAGVAQRPQDAYTAVLARAGAFPRDFVTRRTVADVTARTGAWGARRSAALMDGLRAAAAPADGDDDGMPDAWETAHGLDPATADHARPMPSGYTAIEVYINQLADELTGEGAPAAMPPAPPPPATPPPATPAPPPPTTPPPATPTPAPPPPATPTSPTPAPAPTPPATPAPPPAPALDAAAPDAARPVDARPQDAGAPPDARAASTDGRVAEPPPPPAATPMTPMTPVMPVMPVTPAPVSPSPDAGAADAVPIGPVPGVVGAGCQTARGPASAAGMLLLAGVLGLLALRSRYARALRPARRGAAPTRTGRVPDAGRP